MKYFNTFKGLLLTLLLICTSTVFAHDFEVDGIYYNILSEEDKTVEVTYKGSSFSSQEEYNGSVVIPATTTYSNITYNVVIIGERAFSYCSNLTSVELPNSIIEIKKSAFDNCESLVNINIPNAVTSIGESAFLSCKGITSIQLPNNLTEIGKNLFWGCSSLRDIKINDNISKIGDWAFYNCSELTSIFIPSSVTFIGEYAFYGCKSLNDVYINDISAWCNINFNGGNSQPFMYANNLYLNEEIITELIIPNNLREIKPFVFYGCASLTSVEIPCSVISIGNSAFSDCENLVKIEIPNSITSIGSNAFSRCKGLTNIEIPNSVTSIGNYAFSNCVGLTSIEIPNNVISIGDGMFYYCNNLTNVLLPNNTTSIGEKMFFYCSKLKKIQIPDNVTTIGNSAFYGCSNMTSVNIPNGVTEIGDDAFYNCNNLKEVHIDDIAGWCNIDFYDYHHSNPLYYAKKLYLNDIEVTNVVIPEGITEIKAGAFIYCYSIISVSIPNSVTKIGREAFSDCRWLRNVIIGDGVINIDACAFCNCTSLSNLTLGNNVENIGSLAFGVVSSTFIPNIQSLVIPKSVKFIDNDAFYACNIANIIVEDGNNIYDSRDNCNAIIETSSNTLILGRNNTKIPNSVTSIGEEAFYRMGIKSIIIPHSVVNINKSAFGVCNNLEDIYFEGNPIINANAIPSTAKRHLMLNDNNVADFNTANANTFADVSYTRTISEGKYGTIILPFAPDAASLENYAFYELTENSDDYMKFEEVLTPIANTPYIYTLREGKENIAITGGETTISSSIVTPEVDGWQIIGSFNNQTIDTSNGNYYALSANDNEINRITKNLTVLPYRAYFKSVDASKSALNIYISGTTGVEEILSSEIDGFENGAIFDLCGRKVVEPTNGNIYIKNGKKIMF